MRRALWSLVGGVVVAITVGAGVALATSVTPSGGAPGSSYVVKAPCTSEPQVYVVDLNDNPPATLDPRVGSESSPGSWTFDVKAGNDDQLVSARCGGASDTVRYDVERPALYPGPTYTNFASFRPELAGTTVVGTDCPAGTEASLSLRGTDGYRHATTAPIDRYGNWEVPIPVAAPAGDLKVAASCGGVTYAPIVIHRVGAGTSPSQPPATVGSAKPIPAEPTFTG